MDYLGFYDLKEQPFSIAVDNRFYYDNKLHADALIKLKYAAEHAKGLAVVVGEVGTGKSTLARRMLEELDEEKFESSLLVVIHSSVTSEWLLKRITAQLGAEQTGAGGNSTELIGALYRRLVDLHKAGKKAVVLVDEAQMLRKKEVMEEFRGILNIEIDGQKPVTFIFLGLPELDDTLALDPPLKQRVALRLSLGSFTPEMSADYIRYRLEVAGARREIFTPAAVAAVHLHARGIPRLINTICDNALLEGALRKKGIDPEMIAEIASDLRLQEPKGP